MIDDEFFDIVSNSNNEEDAEAQEFSVNAEDDLADSSVRGEDNSGEHHSHRGERHHHHSSHGHHHHSSHRHHHRRKKDNKFVRFLKKNRYPITVVALCVIIVVLILVLALNYDKKDATDNMGNVVNIVSTESARVEISIFSENVPVTSDVVTEYAGSETNKTAHDVWRDNKGSVRRLDVGLPVKFYYNVLGLPAGVSVKKSVLEISKSSGFDVVRSFTGDGKSDVFEVYFLEAGTNYYYRVVTELSNGTYVSSSSEFKTEKAPRMLNIDGAVNVRDIGGWKTVSGSIIRQGILYRGSEIDGAVIPEYCLTETGKNDMLSVLGIRFDMDLRSKSETPDCKDILGENVKHTYYGAPMYEAIFDESNYEQMRKIFSDLADESNYPIYLHCTHGLDRTGTVCYLLGALLGMSDADLKKEYDLSAFYGGSVNLVSFAVLSDRISNNYDGATTQEKVEQYLLSIGVTADEIAGIRRIFLGE